MDGIYNIRKWLISSLKKVLEENTVVDAHIDEFVGIYDLTDILESSKKIMVKCANELSSLNTKGVSIYLSIDLKSKSIRPSLPVNSYEDLRSEIVKGLMPELIIYCPTEPEIIPVVELHRIPISKSVLDLGENINIFLKENRTVEDIENNRKLQKELLFIYSP